MPECRICKKQINKDNDDWVMPSKNFYYHRKCYEDWKMSTPVTDEGYRAFIYDFLGRDMKFSYDWHMIQAQIDKFVKDKKTIKGIFYTLKYFYEIKGGDWDKGHGGIGIVPFVYNEACAYWVEKENRNKGIVAQIEKQMKEASLRDKVVVRQTKKKKKEYKMNFDEIAAMEDEE